MEARLDRIEKLLAMMLIENMKSANQAAKVKKLSAAGFTNAEIADLLDTKSSVIAVRLSEARKRKNRGA
jgi:DNA-directed RNA polymerase specialized sigma24 family protein